MSEAPLDREAILAERHRILLALDVDAAKRFINEHGGKVPVTTIDWLRVLHLARFDLTTMPADAQTERHIYLARTGAQAVWMLPSTSPYYRAAMDLLFPADIWAAETKAMKR